MRLRTFTAANMQGAMQMVRDALGEDAVIISTRENGKDDVQVTAAYDDATAEAADADYQDWFATLRENAAPAGARPAGASAAAEHPGSLTARLAARQHPHQPARNLEHVPIQVARRIARILKHHGVSDPLLAQLDTQLRALEMADISPYMHYPDPVQRWLCALIAEAFDSAALELQHDSCRHILIGTPGAGKTLTTAKIAAYCVKYDQPVHVITTDNKRAGGVEQLAAITDVLGIELLVAENRQSLKAILSDIPLSETVIVDSAGANPYDFYELKSLAEYASLIELDPVLVYPAGSDPYEADEVARAFSFIGVEKMIITRIDTARRFGSVLNAAHAAGLKFSNVTGSEKILGTFDPCTPEYLTKLFMDYQPDDTA